MLCYIFRDFILRIYQILLRDFVVRPDFYYYLFLERSSQENYKMKIKFFWAFPVPSSQKIHKNEIKLKFYFNFVPALHHKYFRCQVYFFNMLNCPRIIKKHYELILPTKIYFQNKFLFFFHPSL
jgi:hypothetical protein